MRGNAGSQAQEHFVGQPKMFELDSKSFQQLLALDLVSHKDL